MTANRMSIGATRRLGATLALATLALDQASKWWIITDVMNPPTMITVTPFFNLVLGLNTGVSFGMFGGGADFGRWMLSGLALTIAAALAVWLWRVHKPWLSAALGMIIGGAIGNVIDRIRVGAVVDFLDFHAAGYHWPAFNVADMGITVGATILIIDSFFGEAEG
jgi:signal peptidase II